MRHVALLPSVFLALAGLVSAQEIVLRGKVEDVSGTSNQFVVDCTAITLTSSAFDLNLWVGQQVELRGAWNGSRTAPSVDATVLTAVAETFELGGDAKIGGEVRFNATSTPGDLAASFVALGSGFFPTRKAGTLLLDANPMVLVGTGTIAGDGRLEIPVDVPDDPAIVGIEIIGQALIVFAAGGSTWSNPDCKTISQ